MTQHSDKAKKLARRLLKQNRHFSWREIARRYPSCVKPGTLNRIATSRGEWTPKDNALLIALGLKNERKPRRKRITSIAEMSTQDLREEISNRDLPVRLGWLKGNHS